MQMGRIAVERSDRLDRFRKQVMKPSESTRDHEQDAFMGEDAKDKLECVGPDLWPHLIKSLGFLNKQNFAVKALQTALRDLHGFTTVRVDGYFGEYTLSAVKLFQSKYAGNLIDVDGVVGPLTWLHLIGCPEENTGRKD